MRLRSIRGTNQYQTKAVDLDLVICPHCGGFNSKNVGFTKGSFPMPIKWDGVCTHCKKNVYEPVALKTKQKETDD